MKAKEELKDLLSQLEGFITTKSVVGEAIHMGDTILLPLVDVSFGAGAGAQALFSPGDRVMHKVFGAGTVLESNRDKIRIAFDTRGERTFPASIAPIRKIEG